MRSVNLGNTSLLHSALLYFLVSPYTILHWSLTWEWSLKAFCILRLILSSNTVVNFFASFYNGKPKPCTLKFFMCSFADNLGYGTILCIHIILFNLHYNVIRYVPLSFILLIRKLKYRGIKELVEEHITTSVVSSQDWACNHYA